MDYFAHALSFVGRPYFAAGTAVADWLTVGDQRGRRGSPMRVGLCFAPPKLRLRPKGVVRLEAGTAMGAPKKLITAEELWRMDESEVLPRKGRSNG